MIVRWAWEQGAVVSVVVSSISLGYGAAVSIAIWPSAPWRVRDSDPMIVLVLRFTFATYRSQDSVKVLQIIEKQSTNLLNA
jgi:hypothetical protein